MIQIVAATPVVKELLKDRYIVRAGSRSLADFAYFRDLDPTLVYVRMNTYTPILG